MDAKKALEESGRDMKRQRRSLQLRVLLRLRKRLIER